MTTNRDQDRYTLGLKCAVLIEDFHEWRCQNDYLKLMENFLNNKINFEEFDREFLKIWSMNRDKPKTWNEFLAIINNFKLNQFEGFSSVISRLFEDIEIVQSDPLFKEDYEITEEQLKERIKVILLEIKNKYC